MRKSPDRILLAASLVTCAAVVLDGPRMIAQAPRPPAIVSISVCSPTGAGGQGSCPSGGFDTHQIVLAPDGNSINLETAVDSAYANGSF